MRPESEVTTWEPRRKKLQSLRGRRGLRPPAERQKEGSHVPETKPDPTTHYVESHWDPEHTSTIGRFVLHHCKPTRGGRNGGGGWRNGNSKGTGLLGMVV